MTDKQITHTCDATDCEQYYPEHTCCHCRNAEWYGLKEQLKAKEQECEELKEEMGTRCESCKALHIIADDYNDCITENKQLKAENDELKRELMQRDEVDMFFNTPLEGWSNDPCGICRFKQTLTEIKEIAEELLQTKIPFCEIYGRIIDKISEVEDVCNT